MARDNREPTREFLDVLHTGSLGLWGDYQKMFQSHTKYEFLKVNSTSTRKFAKPLRNVNFWKPGNKFSLAPAGGKF